MRKVASKHPFCVLIYMNSYMFRICFILFIFLVKHISNIRFYMLDVIIFDTHGIAKYSRIYIRRYTHKGTHKPKKKKYKE